VCVCVCVMSTTAGNRNLGTVRQQTIGCARLLCYWTTFLIGCIVFMSSWQILGEPLRAKYWDRAELFIESQRYVAQPMCQDPNERVKMARVNECSYHQRRVNDGIFKGALYDYANSFGVCQVFGLCIGPRDINLTYAIPFLFMLAVIVGVALWCMSIVGIISASRTSAIQHRIARYTLPETSGRYMPQQQQRQASIEDTSIDTGKLPLSQNFSLNHITGATFDDNNDDILGATYYDGIEQQQEETSMISGGSGGMFGGSFLSAFTTTSSTKDSVTAAIKKGV